MAVPNEVDTIVCGGGSVDCVSAGRLANLDHNLQVLLIEAGEDNLNNPWLELHPFTPSAEMSRAYRPGIYPRDMKVRIGGRKGLKWH